MMKETARDLNLGMHDQKCDASDFLTRKPCDGELCSDGCRRPRWSSSAIV